ncbi:MAG TPA: biotin/lipoyl-containing protein, partial [Tepidisphaeraceae bacterium]|nr:biotin/lipoyl-containing protein [Tepidisphaeraceae bacterium]
MADLIIPSGGESVTQVTLLRWAKKEGEYVRRDEVVAELETDKANVDLPATASGVLHTKNKPGDVIKVGQVIGQIDESAPAPTGKAPATTAAPAAKPAQTQTAPAAQSAVPQPKAAPAEADDLSPAVRKMVVESGVNPRSIPATGPGGRLLKEDVQRYLEDRSADGNGNGSAAPSAPPAPPIQARTEPAATRPPGPDFSKPTGQAPLTFNADGVARVPMSKIRRRIASTLVQAQQTAAILTTFNEVDLTAIS